MKEIKLSKKQLQELFAAVGEVRLRAILKDFYHRMSDDILIGFFFTGKDILFIAEQQLHFLLRAMGVTPSYSGKPPAGAHEELAPILSGHFDRRLRILEETLTLHKLDAIQIQTWIQFEESFRQAIVKKEG